MASKQVSAETNSKIVNALAPAFKAAKAVKTFVSQAKGVADIGNEAAQAGSVIGQNTKQLEDSKKSADSSDDKKVQGSYKKGGKVKKTGLYRLHKGERVLNAKQTKKVEASGLRNALSGRAKPSSFKDGGVVQKGGLAKVHAGEMVLPKLQAMRPARIISNPDGIRPLKDTDPDPSNWAAQNIPNGYKKPPVGVPGADTSNPKKSGITRLSLREQ